MIPVGRFGGDLVMCLRHFRKHQLQRLLADPLRDPIGALRKEACCIARLRTLRVMLFFPVPDTG